MTGLVRRPGRPQPGLRSGVWLVALLLAITACSSTSDAGPRAGHPSGASRNAGTSRAGPPPAARAPRPWVVALGDSYISGEGARWAGNTSGRSGPVDALGPRAYLPAAPAAGSRGCDRARVSVVSSDLGPMRGVDLACSGATTSSQWDAGVFTPGLDAYSDGHGHHGQLVALRRFAARHRVSDVVVSIGGNDFGFGSILARCTTAFLLTVTRNPSPCRRDPLVRARLTAGRAARVTGHVAAALRHVRQAMRAAGTRASQYSVIVQGYPSPLPPGPRIRYPEDLLHRVVLGGCPLFDADATWANRVALTRINASVRRAVADSALPNASWLDMRSAFAGHRLCERGSAQLQESGLRTWRSPGAMSRLEWVNMVYAKPAPWRVQESLHPDYWGVLAERSCVRAAIRGTAGRARGGSCRAGAFTPASLR